ncbi:exonuclease SbcCD subunit D [Conyzicola nivalis]|uniref:Nuclease SbcCD subunit D n=1 Tax=Conyzicola nivalis TaxID=1477021 RepID=A0A916SEJ1_9MICO|nr:exonuclease SbcCD subunit D [Conyzicola nivalis]GGA95239.1 nuclease SbcCD subunit D [Conyzicola nivalis]
MKILHTSDWHIGRTFHGHSTLEHLRVVLAAMVAEVRERGIDVVVVAGDIFDSSMPSAEAFAVLSGALRDLRGAGVQVVMTSGNHDSATRLGFQSEWATLSGIHIITRPEQHLEPVLIDDEYGPVAFYGIPYLEPSIFRTRHPGEDLRTHEQVLGFVMNQVRSDVAARQVRSVVLSHCFASGVAASNEATDVERDITSGGLNLVPASVFDGPDYVALGHIHGRSVITDRVRYSGAPLHYSFGEANKPRGGWLVELDAGGVDTVEWLDLPVPRRLTVLTGDLDELVGSERYGEFENDWVAAVLTDRVRPMDAMRRLQDRFPFAAMLEYRPAVVAEAGAATYRERIEKKTDDQIVAGFLELVRNGVGPTDFEAALVAEVIAEQAAKEASA